MSEFWADIRFSWRLLRRAPFFALTVILLLGMGIGASTLIFSVVDALLLRPLPVKDPEGLVRVIEVHPNHFITWDLPQELCDTLRSKSATLTDVLSESSLDVAFQRDAAVERIRVNAVSSNFFSTLGIPARIGRVLTPGDEKTGAFQAVLSYAFWQRQFRGLPSALGQSIKLNGRVFTIVGVLPEGINGLTADTSPEVRVPLRAGRALWKTLDVNPLDFRSQIFARLRRGVALTSARAELDPLLSGPYEEAFSRAYPQVGRNLSRNVLSSHFDLEPIAHGVSILRAQFSNGLLLLTAGVGLLLLMACANVACLLLTRSSARAQEMGIRLALGAPRTRIARQLLTESLVLASFGGLLGLLLSYLGKPLLLAAFPPIRDRSAVLQPLALHVDLNMRVLGFSILATFVSALLFGLLPAIRGARQDLATPLRGNRTVTARLWSRNVLVAVQIALCLSLLVGASLLAENFSRMRLMNPGFDRDHIVTFTLDPGMKGYKPEQARLLSRQLLEKTRSLPGVIAAGLAGRGLMRGTGIKATFGVAGQAIERSDFLNSSVNSVTPGYFDAMGMHILAGRDFTWSDGGKQGLNKPNKVIVNRAFAQRFFPRQDALGKLFGAPGSSGPAAPQNQIVGVVNDARYRSLREPIPPTAYSPVVNGFGSDFVLHLRSQGPPASLIPAVRRVLHSLDPELPFTEVATLNQEVDASIWQERLLAWLSMVFGGFAALIAGLGLYGALDYAVRARTREIGIRLALGSSPIHLVWLLSSGTLLVVAAGAISGILLYAVAMRWMRQVLYGVAPSDPWAIASAFFYIALIALLATAAPIRRAIRTDPAPIRHRPCETNRGRAPKSSLGENCAFHSAFGAAD